MIVLTIIKDLNQPDWLESTWCDDENVVWCESYSGHRELYTMMNFLKINNSLGKSTEIN